MAAPLPPAAPPAGPPLPVHARPAAPLAPARRAPAATLCADADNWASPDLHFGDEVYGSLSYQVGCMI